LAGFCFVKGLGMKGKRAFAREALRYREDGARRMRTARSMGPRVDLLDLMLSGRRLARYKVADGSILQAPRGSEAL
jgi:hypothetical protein